MFLRFQILFFMDFVSEVVPLLLLYFRNRRKIWDDALQFNFYRIPHLSVCVSDAAGLHHWNIELFHLRVMPLLVQSLSFAYARAWFHQIIWTRELTCLALKQIGI